MILEILFLIVMIRIWFQSFETMKCRDVVIEDAPITNIYDLLYDISTNSYTNPIFEKTQKEYTEKLNQYFEDIKTYCT